MPSIENLKKQAKQFLRWHREGHYPVAAEIRHALARFRHASDAEIMAAPFTLHDAQELVARRAGFESWPALKSGADDMSQREQPTTARAMLSGAEPQLFVTDIEGACAFFARLGFETVFTYGEPPFYGQVARDAARLNLRHVDRPVMDATLREKEALLAATITLDAAEAIKALFLEFQQADIPFHQRLRTEPWGSRTFIIRDPDGNLLLFAGPA